MIDKNNLSPERLRYIKLLSKQYPTVQTAGSEIIRLQAILNLPKGTEHFLSDIHGEHEAFQHILNSCSGEVKKKIDECFGNFLTAEDHEDLAFLVYYPAEKLAMVAGTAEADRHYRVLLYRLIDLARHCCSKYTRSDVREALSDNYADIIDELLHIREKEEDKKDYFESRKHRFYFFY